MFFAARDVWIECCQKVTGTWIRCQICLSNENVITIHLITPAKNYRQLDSHNLIFLLRMLREDSMIVSEMWEVKDSYSTINHNKYNQLKLG